MRKLKVRLKDFSQVTEGVGFFDLSSVLFVSYHNSSKVTGAFVKLTSCLKCLGDNMLC